MLAFGLDDQLSVVASRLVGLSLGLKNFVLALVSVSRVRSLTIALPVPVNRRQFNTQHLRPAGFLSCWPDRLKLISLSRILPGSNEQYYRLFQASTQNVPVHPGH